MLAEPPTHAGPTVIESPEARRAFLNDLCALGLARLRGLRPDDGPALAALLGPVRSSNFGDFWDVKAVVDHRGDAATNTTANTSLRLGPHTDLPTRETPPGFQFLHCVENEAVGGYSTMADGLALVDHLERENPAALEALTTLRWVFANRGMGIDHRWTGPMIELAGDGHPITFRAFYPLRAFPDMAPDDLPRAYEAMSLFSTLADSDAFRLAYPFRPGDLVAFDNRRILHGRDAFSVEGTRHLKGFYIDHDDVFSSARTLNRRAGEPVPGPSVDMTLTPERVT
jgi:gamma-butyrobetaine dioxygenase